MSTDAMDAATQAAMDVMKALQPLSPEEKARVLRSAAALHEIPWGSRSTGVDSGTSTGNEPNGDEDEASAARKSTGGKRLSVVEFLGTKSPASNSQRIAAFAHYHEHVIGKDKFSRSDLEQYFGAAKLPRPKNYARDFASAVAEGWIHEDGSESYLTQAGERAVQAGFGGKGKARGRAVAERKGKKDKTT